MNNTKEKCAFCLFDSVELKEREFLFSNSKENTLKSQT